MHRITLYADPFLARAIVLGAFLFLTAALAFAQAPQPTPPDDNSVVKITTDLIQIDVTVTDSKGKVVSDLRPDEIEIYENGKRQTVSNFSFISAARTTGEKAVPLDKNAVAVPPQVLRPEQVRRTIAIVVDDLTLSFESAYQTRRALKKFVDEQMRDGDLIAIIRTGAGIGALQQFTSDKRMLYAAVDKVKWNPNGTGGVSAFAPIESSPDTSLQTGADDTGTSDDTQTLSPAGQMIEDFRRAVFATGTLGSLKYIVSGMGELPGRKSVILFSDGFKLFETDEMGFQDSGRVMDYMRQLVDLATRSSVVFYTIDGRGLANTGFTAADNISDTSPDAMNRAASGRRDELHDTQDGLSYLADETGGFAVLNNNDLSSGVRRVLDDQSYYLVGYEPDTVTFDPAKSKYNSLSVKVLRKGVTVRYRSGFFNVADNRMSKAAPPVSRQEQLETALISPFGVSGIDLRLNALFGNDARGASFVRSLLHIKAGDLKFTDERDGTKKAVFDVLAMSFGDNGQIVDSISKTYTMSLKAAAYQKVIADGFVYHFVFPVKKPGAYQYRIAIRDAQGGKVGSASQFIEVPDLGKHRLTTSSIVLENLTADQWRKTAEPTALRLLTDPMSDTALRRVKLGTVLRYGLEIYNAKLNGTNQPGVRTRVRVFRDGKLILDGKETPLELRGQTDVRHLKAAGAVAIGDKLTPGDYVLQVIVTDELAKAKQQIATQYVQFEVVE